MTGEFERGFPDDERPDWEQGEGAYYLEPGLHGESPADGDGADWGDGAEDDEWQEAEEESVDLPEEDGERAPLSSPAPRLTGGSGKSRKRLGWDGLPKGRHLVKRDELR